MLLTFQRYKTEDKQVAIRASAILAAYDLIEGSGCEISYTTATGEIHIARVVESAARVCEAVNRNTDRPDKVKFVVAVPDDRLGYGVAMNIARTVRDMVDVVERGE